MSLSSARAARAGGGVLGAMLVAFLAGGCATAFEPKASVGPLGSEPDHHVVTKTASLATTLVVPRNTRYFICSSPPPDALFTQAESVAVSINLLNFGKGTDDGAQESSAEEEMIGRTPSVVLARELLYRFCEFQLNQQLTRDQAIELYRQNLAIIREIAMKEAANTRLTIGESQTVNAVQGPARNAPAKPATASFSPSLPAQESLPVAESLPSAETDPSLPAPETSQDGAAQQN